MGSYRHLEASDDERARFPDLDAVLAAAGALAAEPNRLREVRVLETPAGRYYLKVFMRTQPKNRMHFALTAPRCGCDAEREALVTAALRQSGVVTPRPVALARRGPASYYLCAELPGRTLAAALQDGAVDRATGLAAARFCGRIAARGVALPDLSADHVYLLPGGGFGVLDLHNGQLIGAPRKRLAVRILRHFRRSVRGLSLSRRAALSFATALVRAMGLGSDLRAILQRLPPLDTHGRYDRPGKSGAYRSRNPQRHRRELAQLRAVWPGRPGDTVLDAPCGAGRIGSALSEQHGARVIGADRSAAMLGEARDAGIERLVLADAARLPFGDRVADGVVVFRFLHHVEGRDARAVLAEATRVADRYVVVSFFHPLSTHGLRRRLREVVTRRPRTRHTVRRRRLRAWMAAHGFEPVAWRAELPFLKELWVAAFVRRGPADRA